MTTDFGQADGYVGIMKGVILGIAPGTPLVDISHALGAQNVAEGAFVLARAYPYFPPGTVHLAVVDPGVGSARRPLLLCTAQGYFVGPDNGLFTDVLDAAPDARAYELNNPAYWLPQVSTTFHGRDIFAPSAAHLARGVAPDTLGRPIPLADLVRLPGRRPTRAGHTLTGQISHIDRFGNAVTNIPAALLSELGAAALTIRVGAHRLDGLHTTYAAVAPGEALALIGSAGLLEIAVRNGDAARRFGIRVGDSVQCRRSAEETDPAR